MKIKIKPIIRPKGKADKLVDVIDVDGEQTAVIVRAYPTRAEAQKHDGVTVEEELDVTGFLGERELKQAEADEQTAKDEAQDAVTKELAKACDGFAFLFEKYVTDMTDGEKAAVKVFRDKYAAWKALQ